MWTRPISCGVHGWARPSERRGGRGGEHVTCARPSLASYSPPRRCAYISVHATVSQRRPGSFFQFAR
eukprot:4956367-Prymnesium_polylepis.1